MITVISGTNRPNSRTKIIANFCFDYLKNKSEEETAFLDLVDINLPVLTDRMYEKDGQHAAISSIQDQILIPSQHWLIISPEYNGSFPGALKLLIDSVSVRKINETFAGKKCSLIGVASGKAGNFRGMEHLTGLLNYLNVLVMPKKLPISSVENQIDEHGMLNKVTQKILEQYIDELLVFNKLYKVETLSV